MEQIKQKTFDEWIDGRVCKSCAVFDPNTFCFMLEPKNHYLVHRLKEENGDDKPQDYGLKFKQDIQYRLSAHPQKPELIIKTLGGNIFYQVGSKGNSENLLSRDDIRSVNNVRYIGNHFYVTGFRRAVLRRDGIEKWTHISRELGTDKSKKISFYDIDGFNEDDMYAVGDEGEAWHYNGKEWIQLDIPTNVDFYSVCCASDGNVYIGGVFHTIVKGRNDIWEVINHEFTNNQFQQIVDYNGRLLTVNEWGNTLYEIKPDGVTNMDTGDFDLTGGECLCLAVGHGMLLVAGRESAAVFDGKKWYSLFSRDQAISDEDLMKELVQRAGEGLDDLKDALDDLD